MAEEQRGSAGVVNAPQGDPEVVKALGIGKKQTSRRLVRALTAGLGVALVAALGVRAARARGEASATKYVDAEVVRGDLQVTVSATGTIKGLNTVEVGAEVSGRVTQVLVDYNDRVEVGQPLAVIDPEQLQAARDESSARVAASEAMVRQAQATVEETRLALERAEASVKEGIVSQKDLESARAAASRARAALSNAQADATLSRATQKSAKSKLDKTRIVSPVKGVVLARLIEPGQTVTAGFTTPVLFKLAEDLTKMRLHVYVDEADVGRVREGQDATFTVDAFPGKVFTSKVLSLRNEPKNESNVVSYEAVLAVDNKDLLLRPGMTATATIIVDARKDALLVPNAALRFVPPAPPRTGFGPPGGGPKPAAKATGPHVYILRDQKPVSVDVKTVASDGSRTEIEPGSLEPGAHVIVDTSEEGGR